MYNEGVNPGQDKPTSVRYKILLIGAVFISAGLSGTAASALAPCPAPNAVANNMQALSSTGEAQIGAVRWVLHPIADVPAKVKGLTTKELLGGFWKGSKTSTPTIQAAEVITPHGSIGQLCRYRVKYSLINAMFELLEAPARAAPVVHAPAAPGHAAPHGANDNNAPAAPEHVTHAQPAPPPPPPPPAPLVKVTVPGKGAVNIKEGAGTLRKVSPNEAKQPGGEGHMNALQQAILKRREAMQPAKEGTLAKGAKCSKDQDCKSGLACDAGTLTCEPPNDKDFK
jgi:hypothetical protein